MKLLTMNMMRDTQHTFHNESYGKPYDTRYFVYGDVENLETKELISPLTPYSELNRLWNKDKIGHGAIQKRERDICIARLRKDIKDAERRISTSCPSISTVKNISGKFPNPTSFLSKEQVLKWLALCKEWKYVNEDFDIDMWMKKGEWHWELMKHNQQQWNWWFCSIRMVTEHPHLIKAVLYLMDKYKIHFAIANPLVALHLANNSWHCLFMNYANTVSSEPVRKNAFCGFNIYGYIEKEIQLKWKTDSWGDRPAVRFDRRIRIYENTDINKIIRIAIKAHKFLNRTDLPLLSETGWIEPIAMQKTVWKEKVRKEEWNYKFGYGDFNKLINFNPFERMKQ